MVFWTISKQQQERKLYNFCVICVLRPKIMQIIPVFCLFVCANTGQFPHTIQSHSYVLLQCQWSTPSGYEHVCYIYPYIHKSWKYNANKANYGTIFDGIYSTVFVYQ